MRLPKSVLKFQLRNDFVINSISGIILWIRKRNKIARRLDAGAFKKGVADPNIMNPFVNK